MATRRNFSKRSSGPRPRYVWVPGTNGDQGVSAGLTSSADLLGNYFADTGREVGPGMVIERIVGNVIVESQTAGTGSNYFLGLSLVDEGGWGSTPQPETEIIDLLWWWGSETNQGSTEIFAGTFRPIQTFIHFDVKSRRRIRSVGEEMRMILESSAAPGFNVVIATRTLLRVT